MDIFRKTVSEKDYLRKISSAYKLYTALEESVRNIRSITRRDSQGFLIECVNEIGNNLKYSLVSPTFSQLVKRIDPSILWYTHVIHEAADCIGGNRRIYIDMIEGRASAKLESDLKKIEKWQEKKKKEIYVA